MPAAAPDVPGLDACRVGFALDDRSRPIVAALKYRRERRIAGWAASALADHVPRLADAITWIPSTPARRRSRGFDQAAELARSLGSATSVPTLGLLERDRSDERQTGRSRRERLRGPALHVRRPAPPFVVVVDDVVTTGSSMRAAARILRDAGAERVVGVALTATPNTRDERPGSATIASIIPAWT